MWQADFKGKFKTKDGKYCYPLDILDDHSRFAIKIAASDTTANVVIPAFRAAFLEYGLFHVIKVNSWGYVRFDRFQVYLSESMIGEHVEFRPNSDGERFDICFRNFKIAEYGTADARLLNRSISRL